MDPKDLKIEVYKSGGPGGQHKNKRFTSVRITHLPTGVAAISAGERSQAANKQIAIERLKEKLAQKFKKKKPRFATKLPKSVKEDILRWKKKQGLKKRMRRERFTPEEN